MSVAIIGAGLAGLACAERLLAGGREVVLFDKGRGPGGRMSTRRLGSPAGNISFDHGAQYFTVREPAFRTAVEAWIAAELVLPWPAAGPEAYVGVPSMNAPVKALASAFDTRWSSEVKSLAQAGSGWTIKGDGVTDAAFEAIVLAVPAEQAVPLLSPHHSGFSRIAEATASGPCWSVMVGFPERIAQPADVLRPSGPIGWAARNSSKPGRHGPEAWILQASPVWSEANLETDAKIVQSALLGAFASLVGAPLPDPLCLEAHRWRYARSGSAGVGVQWESELRLGVCGDWLIGPRVEAAWMSGRALADQILLAP